MHPILFKLFGFPVGTYGVILSSGALAALGLARRLAPRAGLDRDKLTDLLVYALLASFAGAKVALILGDFREFADHPVRFLVENLRSYGAFYGGFAGGVSVALLYMRRAGISFWRAADVAAVALPLAQGIGRWGCFFAGCCYGKPTTLPWGLVFPAVDLCADGTRIHPWPLYESAADLLLFGVLLWLFARRAFIGQAFLVYVFGYAAARGILEFWRGDAVRGLYFGGTVSLSQLAAAGAFAAAAVAWAWRRRNPAARLSPPASDG